MPIVARDLDISEKKVVLTHLFQGSAVAGTYLISGIGNGTTLPAWVMPFPFEVVSVGSGVAGLSGTINLQLQNFRTLYGTGGGATMFGAMNSSFALSSLGTSGSQYAVNIAGSTQLVGWSLPATGSTILQGQVGDVLTLVAVGSGACTQAAITVVVKKLQDIASHFNIST
jgi:hypothetical protein